MSRSNYDKPFYVDVGTSVAAIRCASNHDVVDSLDHNGSEHAIKIVERTCDRMNREVELSLGNAAAMREALKNLVDRTSEYIKECNPSIAGGCEIRRALENAKDALAKPPKNCDRFETREDAQDAFEAQYSERGKEALGRYPIAALDAFCDWLFATATEQKGGNDGK